jgi:hypothetical protein
MIDKNCKEQKINPISRRRFVQLISGAAVGGIATADMAFAGGHAKVNPEDPQPTALGYVEDAATVDKEKWTQFTDGSTCSGCALYSGGEGKAYGPCGVFPGQEVSAIGWCSAFNAKA